MPDREKVIKGLEACTDINCRDCPYPCFCEYADDWPKQLHRDALALLKEQDTKTGYWITEEPNTYTRRTYCSVCSKSAPFICVSDDYYGGRSHGETKKTKYCPNCGAKMET